jgi:hypothetical protein
MHIRYSHARLGLAIVTLMIAPGCVAKTVHPASFDASRGVATIYFQPRTSGRGAWAKAYLPCEVEVRGGPGVAVRVPYTDVQRRVGLELNPGHYAITARNCRVCQSANVIEGLLLDAQKGETYRLLVASIDETPESTAIELVVVDAGDHVLSRVRKSVCTLSASSL